MRILVIDNNIEPASWGSADLRRFAALTPGANVQVRRAPEEDLPSDSAGFDRIVVSGSKTSALEDAPWIFRLHEFIRDALDRNKPFLGVCYGHQALIRSLGGKETVRRGENAEFGWSEIELLERSPLTQGLPAKFHTFSSHFEEVVNLPKGVRRLARSRDCEIQACQLEDKPVYGIQFHPEKDLAGAIQTLQYRKKIGSPKALLREDESERLFDAKVGETIFRNFFSL